MSICLGGSGKYLLIIFDNLEFLALQGASAITGVEFRSDYLPAVVGNRVVLPMYVLPTRTMALRAWLVTPIMKMLRIPRCLHVCVCVCACVHRLAEDDFAFESVLKRCAAWTQVQIFHREHYFRGRLTTEGGPTGKK